MPSRPEIFRIETAIVTGSLLTISALSWILSASPFDMTMISNVYQIDLTMMLLFASSWALGMVAMMFPTVVPVIMMFFVAGRNAREEVRAGGGPTVTKAFVFATVYISLWIGLGVALYLALGIISPAVTLVGGLEGYSALLAPVVVLGSGIYQLAPLKGRCLDRCHPSSFVYRNFRSGNRGAALMGASYGVYCLGCCWVLMINLLLVGAMNLAWMGVFAAAILIERVSPMSWHVRAIVGISLIAIGALMLGRAFIP